MMQHVKKPIHRIIAQYNKLKKIYPKIKYDAGSWKAGMVSQVYYACLKIITDAVG